jgi:hypothetical protein
MAKYRVEVDLSFDKEADALELLNAIEKIKTKAYTPEPIANGFPVAQNCRVHLCYHDENPAKSCSTYTNVDFKSVEKTHTEIAVPAK